MAEVTLTSVADLLAERHAQFLRHARGGRVANGAIGGGSLLVRRPQREHRLPGTCVDLPEPVGADKTSRRHQDFNRAMMSLSMS